MASSKELSLRLKATAEAVEAAIGAIGLGYDLTQDLRIKYCKKQSRLIPIDDGQARDIALPCGILVQNVPTSINCDKGERLRFSSDVLSFQQMSVQFNQELGLTGKIPNGHFNAAFEFTGSWQNDLAYTKSLAFDSVSITLYSIALEKTKLVLRDDIKNVVPSSWDPAAVARFIAKYGTHIVVGVKIGGKDVVYIKQQHSSPLEPAEIQKKLKDFADKRFNEGHGQGNQHESIHNGDMFDSNERAHNFFDTSRGGIYLQNEDIAFFGRRRGGSGNKTVSHNKWCQLVAFEPDVISMSFIPISSLLSGICGSGYLTYAINLYLRYKPPIEELHQFLELQIPKQWAPVYGELPLGHKRKQQIGESLQFSLMGPKLYVNTNPVDVGNKPVTGLRFFLEGKRSNCLAIHLQHLTTLPKTFQLQIERNLERSNNSIDHRYYEKVQWKSFSHVCTAPIESDDDISIVTGARLEIKESRMKNVLFLRLIFSKVVNATVVKKPEWDGSHVINQKSGFISALISSSIYLTNDKPPPRPSDVDINSALYPDGPPVATQMPKLYRFVDTTEMTRGPQDLPGYWVVSGARLVVNRSKISIRVKYSLLTVILPEEDDP